MLLVVLMQLAQPGVVTQSWVGSTIRAAIPLAILAACQTLAMLTGGIDLSVGTVASMAAFIMATQTGSLGPGAGDRPRPAGGPHRRASRTASAWASSRSTR